MVGNKREVVDHLLQVEDPMFRQFCHGNGHGVPHISPLPTDTITGASVEKNGCVDGDDDNYGDEDDDSIGMLVEEDVDQVNYRFENGHGLRPVSLLD